MDKSNKTISVTIDNKVLKVERGMTILEAAQQHGIYIPTLCAHKDLTPFGGCRMCVVEVEGMRGLPTACTTPAQPGMIIRTNTAQVQSERKEILNLILSEHPSSCLICDESDECREYMSTVRKAGVTTGCRYCPNDEQCELQEVARKLGLKEIKYPIYYRNFEVKKDDPFFDRDYNLCILCGRCVRMCQEVRAANILAFKQRGSQTVIGPAYDRSHVNAGCEFCGACVSVCPTGALSEKARKWRGKPDREQVTTCAFCGVGCQIRLLVKDEEVIGSLPSDDSLINNDQLCVKGRFCITELVNSHHRLRRPQKRWNGAHTEISWDQAIEQAASNLSACPPNRFGMLISPNCTNEDLFIAQKFVRVAMGSHNIDTTARGFYGPAFNAYLELLSRASSLMDLQKASAILCFGLDTRFGRSVVGVELRRAMQRGAKIITINPRVHNLTMLADRWLRPIPGKERDVIRALVDLTGTRKKSGRVRTGPKGKDIDKRLLETAEMLINSSTPVILVGPEFMRYDAGPRMFEDIAKLAQNIGAGILALPAWNNLFGSILMGAYPELLPGGVSSANTRNLNKLRRTWNKDIPDPVSRWNSLRLASGPRSKMNMLYLAGEVLSSPTPPADFIIFQNIYAPDASIAADLILPSAAFTEADGTFINGEGRIQRVRKAIEPRGEVLPDWEILCRIARKMGKRGFDYSNAAEIHNEISSLIEGFGDFDNPERNMVSLTCESKMTIPRTKAPEKKAVSTKFPFLLYTSIDENTYRGFALSTRVEGLKRLFTEGIIDISPRDAQEAGLSEGDEVVVNSADFERTWRVSIKGGQPRGALHVTLRQGELIGANPYPVRIRKQHV